MKSAALLASFLLVAACATSADWIVAPPGRTPWDALMEGNRRFVAGGAEHPHQTTARRDEVAKGQAPSAIVLACSDSRVAPEIAFDQGLGDLFVVRVAGNVADANALGSMEYAAE